MASCSSPAQSTQVAEALKWSAAASLCCRIGIQAVRRRLSLMRPELVVARWTRVDRWRSRHAPAISASFSFSAGESSTTGDVRRGGRLLELTERDTERDAEREVLLEAIIIPASRVRVLVKSCFTDQVRFLGARASRCVVAKQTEKYVFAET
jgi:hypothetical protein